MLKLDIGCGGRGSRQPGFLGIDTWPLPPGKTKDEYFRLDFLTAELPWTHNTVDEAIALHIIEHLMPEDGHRLVQRAVDLLKPGAALTVTCPDLNMLATAYVEGNDAFLETKHLNGGRDIWPGETRADRLNWAIHQETHKWSYDTASLSYHLDKAVGDRTVMSTIVPGSEWNTRPDHEIGFKLVKL